LPAGKNRTRFLVHGDPLRYGDEHESLARLSDLAGCVNWTLG
jgi:hypothetical protein